MQRISVVVAALAVMVCARAECLWAGGQEELLAYLKARDSSIESYRLDMRKSGCKMKASDYPVIEEFVRHMRAAGPNEADPAKDVNDLMQRLGAKAPWRDEKAIYKGERFKIVDADTANALVRTYQYDGQLFREYHSDYGEIGVSRTIPNVGWPQLSRFGIAWKNALDPLSTISFEKDDKGIRYTYVPKDANSTTVTMEYDPHMNLLNWNTRVGHGMLADFWYFLHGTFDGYQVAKVHLDVQGSIELDEYYVFVCLLDDVHINCPITDEDLAVPKLPQGTKGQ
jgi:hypothetical protein